VLLDCVEQNLDLSQAANHILLFRADLVQLFFQGTDVALPVAAGFGDFPPANHTWFRRSRKVYLCRLASDPFREQVEDIVHSWSVRSLTIKECEDELRWALSPGPPRCLCVHQTSSDFVIPRREALLAWARGEHLYTRQAQPFPLL
jgi:hypothetical protein